MPSKANYGQGISTVGNRTKQIYAQRGFQVNRKSKDGIKHYSWSLKDMCNYLNVTRREMILFLNSSDTIQHYAIRFAMIDYIDPVEVNLKFRELFNISTAKSPKTMLFFTSQFINEYKDSIHFAIQLQESLLDEQSKKSRG